MQGYRREHAFAVARAIKSRSQVPGNIYVFGSARSYKDFGRDIDLLVEVPAETFEEFRSGCDTQGVDPISARVNHLPGILPDLFWNYFSPEEVRSGVAFEILGVSRDDILNTDGMDIPRKALDIICLPVGWNTSPLIEKLQLEMSSHPRCDPNFMQNLRDSALLVE